MEGCRRARTIRQSCADRRLLQLPFVFIHPSKLKWMFNIKAIVVPIVAVGMLIWVGNLSAKLILGGQESRTRRVRSAVQPCQSCRFRLAPFHRLHVLCHGLPGHMGYSEYASLQPS